MKKLFAFGLSLFIAGSASAQDISITNNSCESVVVVIYGDDDACDNWLYLSSNYTLRPRTTLNLSMLPGGAYPQVDWISGNIPTGPGNYFSSMKIMDAPVNWVSILSNACLGSTSFTQTASSCIIHGTWTDLAFPGSASVSIY